MEDIFLILSDINIPKNGRIRIEKAERRILI
jgi:hypothetical protein